MTLEILISTMCERISDVANVLLPQRSDVRYVVSMQYDDESERELVPEALLMRSDVVMCYDKCRGLSRNRNNALRHANADICWVVDDDCVIEPNAVDKILAFYRENEVADVVMFQATGTDGGKLHFFPKETTVYSKAFAAGYYPCSVEMTFRRFIGVTFDERFGLGTPLPMGEEAVFANACQKKGLQIYVEPSIVVRTPADTTGTHFAERAELQRAKGAVFAVLFGRMGAMWRTLKEAIHYGVRGKGNAFAIFRNMMEGVWQ